MIRFTSISYDKCDDLDFDIVFFPFLDSDVWVSSPLTDFNARNRSLTTNKAIDIINNKDIDIINFGKLFLNFTVVTLNWFLNIIPD